jgi:exodeoxyribonuclease VII large subunit
MSLVPDPGQVLSVGALTYQVKSRLEGEFGEVWVRGEVSNLRRQASGHLYFTLKDDGAQISAVMFRNDASRLQTPLRDGMEVVVFGGLSVYPPRGNYQLIVRFLVDEGLGALQRKFEALKAKLGGEGLFDATRKKPLPEMPSKVVVITSPTGAALRDFVSILRRRNWSGTLRILPVRVQGNEAAPEIVAMLERADRERLGEVIVLTRGGGSLEDLWPFNEEIVARAVAAAELPVISAVGHEIDFTLSDFAADRRAETPSAAAELISSEYVRFVERTKRLGLELERTVTRRLERENQRLRLWRQTLRTHSPQARVEQAWLRLDDLGGRLQQATQRRLEQEERLLERLGQRFVRRDPELKLEAARAHLGQMAKRLRSASPESVLARGFALVRDAEGRVRETLGDLPANTAIELEMRDGRGRFRRDDPLVQGELGLD